MSGVKQNLFRMRINSKKINHRDTEDTEKDKMKN